MDNLHDATTREVHMGRCIIYVLSGHSTSFHPGILVLVFFFPFACEELEVLAQHPQ